MLWPDRKSGPSWTEILEYLAALDSLHHATTWLDMSSAGSKHATVWRVAAVTVLPVLSGQESVRRVVSVLTWPNVDSADLASAIFKLIVDHDYKISRGAYKQGQLFGA
jgi:hypothetical protein